ncbi:SlyX family protein [Simiduia litorea]|uniref:SlyX family protein n=1 Tax=Simiduia litorea TaxID=1435348 RepID=UPI0036F1964B
MSDDLVEQLQGRIDELEMRQAFQEDTLTELNAILARQDAEILKLIAQVRSLSDKHLDLQYRIDQGGDVSNDRPPHY